MSNNPYQTPTGQLSTDDDQAYGDIKFFDPSGRLNRLRYWAHGMLFGLAFYAIAGIGFALVMAGSMGIGFTIIGIGYIALLVISFIVMIQRLHDLDKSGWMSLLALVPLANIYLIVLLIFFKGTPGRNRFGLQTPPNKTWHWIAALVLPVIAVIGIVAAIAIPAYHDYAERSQAYQDESYNPDSATSEEYYYEEPATEDAAEQVTEEIQDTVEQTTEGETYESDTMESESETDAASEIDSMTEGETTDENTAQ